MNNFRFGKFLHLVAKIGHISKEEPKELNFPYKTWKQMVVEHLFFCVHSPFAIELRKFGLNQLTEGPPPQLFAVS